MNLSVKSYKISDFTDKAIISNVYLLPDFLVLLNKYFKLEAKYLVVKNNTTQEIVGITASFEKKIVGIPSIINPQISYYQPLQIFSLHKKNPNENQIQEIEIQKMISQYYHKHYFKIDKNLSTQTSDIRGFLWSGLTCIPFYTYVFDLNNYSSENFFRKQRASLRKAESLGYSFVQRKDIDSFLNLVEGTKKRQDWNFHIPNALLKEYINELIDLGLVKQFSITNSTNRIISTMFCLMDQTNRIAYAWLASTALDELSNGASTLLFHSISEYLRASYDVFDLCGANTETIARFKASLGAELQVFYRIKL